MFLGIGVTPILFALFSVNNVLKRDAGTADMQRISNDIKKKRRGFPARQNKTIGLLVNAIDSRQ